MAKAKTFFRGALRLVIDPTDAATPAMVYCGKESATFDCAMGEGHVESRELTSVECEWLNTFVDRVDEAYKAARAGNPEYSA